MMLNKIAIIFFSLFCLTISFGAHAQEKGRIIYLNGVSSSGKSTLSHLLQDRLKDPYLVIGIDYVAQMMPPALSSDEDGKQMPGFWWTSGLDDTGHFVQHVHLGPYAQKLWKTYLQMVALLARSGHNVIVDDVSFGSIDVDQWREALKEFDVVYIAMKLPLEEVERRERLRGDRAIGSARGAYDLVHEGVEYDMEWNGEGPVLDFVRKVIHKVETAK